MKKVLALTLALVLLLGLVACGAKPGTTTGEGANGADIPEEARYGGVLNKQYGSCADTFDPHYTTGWVSYAWTNNVYENPIARDDQGNFVPCVCDFELNEDMTVLKLWVREGVTFHNGDPVEIEDVVASIERSASMVSNMKKYWAPYVASVTVEDGVATYTFTEFNINTLLYVAHWATWAAVLPQEVCEKYGADPINQLEDAIGTGPYYVAEYQTNSLYRLNRYDAYVAVEGDWGGYGQTKKAYMDQINIWINQDATSSVMALFNGDYDIGSLSGEYVTMAADYGLVGIKNPQKNMMAMAFNTLNPNRPTSDVNVRKAIAAAIDYDSMAQAWTEEAYEIDARPMMAPYDDDVFNTADYQGAANLELAKEYLAKSNYNGEEIVLLAGPGSGPAIIWDANLKALGLNVKIEYMEGTTRKAYYGDNSNPYDCVTFEYEVKDSVPCQLSSTPREKFWGSELKDKLFADMTKVPAASEESIAIWHELAQHWVDDCSVVNFATFTTSRFHHPDLVPNYPGLEFDYNAYWVNPAEHQ